jgi:DNA-binding XRE family transcriptional regulator
MNRPVRTKTPSGEEIVMLSAAEYDRLVELAEDAADIRHAEQALAELAAGTMETLSQADVEAMLAAPSQISFWRKRRGLTQAELARKAKISQAYLAQMEGAKRTGDVGLYRRLAEILRIDIEDLLPAEEEEKPLRKPARRTMRRK